MTNNHPQNSNQKRPSRRLVEYRASLVGVGILLLLFFGIAIFLIVFPRSTKSDIEKRELAKFPAFSFQTYFSGEFTADIATFYDDTVPYRDNFKNMSNNLKGLFGIQSNNQAVIIGTPVKTVNNDPISSEGDAVSSEQTSSVTIAEQEPDQTDFTKETADGEISPENGMLIVNLDGHWRGLELFGGGTGNNYVNALNKLRDKVDSKVKIYSMIAPMASEFYTPSNFSQYNSSQADCFASIAGRLKDGITSVDCLSAMQKHTEEDIYCRTDHHWQPLGAYYAARTFAEAAGVPFADLDKDYTKKETEGFVGTLYAFSSDSRLLNDPETFTYYEPKASYSTYYYDTGFHFQEKGELLVEVDTTNSYLRFLGGDEQCAKIKTNVNNGRKLLVIKDSYGNAEIPFYTSSFAEIYVIDMRYFECNLVDFIDRMDITDVLFTMASYSAVGENAKNIDNLITQNSGEAITDDATD
ncbi:MAG: DHHW family protein [Oscillospiraceae bacterium]|nr:DHHW family protein [Oscillospiraceae bacterium]